MALSDTMSKLGKSIINLMNTRADRDLSNLTSTGESKLVSASGGLTQNQITNCLLEVPQRIKYTLADGTLTIKAGSVCIVPYGTEDKTMDLPKGTTFINENLKVYDTQFADGKFFVWAELQNDTRAFSFPATGKGQIFYYFKGSEFGFTGLLLDRISSGTTAPTETNTQYWFDTNNNLVKEYGNKAFTGKICSFPLGIGTIGANDTWTEISQVFNGMGYIGSTVWVDKGVKGLIPNGRNTSESLINEKVTTGKLVMQTIGSFTEPNARLAYLPVELWDSHLDYVPKSIIYEQNAKPQITNSNYRWYDTINNKWYVFDISASISQYAQFLELAGMSYTNGKITSFTPKLPFRALDYSDKTKVTSWSFPSDKYIDLPLGASNTTYIAPADGYITIVYNKGAASFAQASIILKNGNQDGLSSRSHSSVFNAMVFMPVYKGQTYTVMYQGEGLGRFRFYYTVGSEPST